MQEDARNVVQTIENYGSVGNIESVALIAYGWLDRFPVLSGLRVSKGVVCLARRYPCGTLQIGMDLDRIRTRQP